MPSRIESPNKERMLRCESLLLYGKEKRCVFFCLDVILISIITYVTNAIRILRISMFIFNFDFDEFDGRI